MNLTVEFSTHVKKATSILDCSSYYRFLLCMEQTHKMKTILELDWMVKKLHRIYIIIWFNVDKMKKGEFDEQSEQDEQAEFERQFLAERIEREIERRERERLFEEDSKIEDARYDWWCQVSRLYFKGSCNDLMFLSSCRFFFVSCLFLVRLS